MFTLLTYYFYTKKNTKKKTASIQFIALRKLVWRERETYLEKQICTSSLYSQPHAAFSYTTCSSNEQPVMYEIKRCWRAREHLITSWRHSKCCFDVIKPYHASNSKCWLEWWTSQTQSCKRCNHKIKGVWTKAPFNGGFAFAWLSTKLCARLQPPDLFMNRPAIKFLILRRAS